MPDAPPAIYSAPSRTPGNVGTVLVTPSAPTAPLAFYTAPTRTPGNVGSVLVTPSTPADPIAPPARPAPSPGNVGTVLVTPSAPAAPLAFYTPPTRTPANVGSVLVTPGAPSDPIAPPARTAASPVTPSAAFVSDPSFIGVRATMSISLMGQPSVGDAMAIDSEIYYFCSEIAWSSDILIGTDYHATGNNLAARITAISEKVTAAFENSTLLITARNTGVIGNAIRVAGGQSLYPSDYVNLTGGSGPSAPAAITA